MKKTVCKQAWGTQPTAASELKEAVVEGEEEDQSGKDAVAKNTPSHYPGKSLHGQHHEARFWISVNSQILR